MNIIFECEKCGSKIVTWRGSEGYCEKCNDFFVLTPLQIRELEKKTAPRPICMNMNDINPVCDYDGNPITG